MKRYIQFIVFLFTFTLIGHAWGKECYVGCEVHKKKDGKIQFAYTGLGQTCQQAYNSCSSKSQQEKPEKGRCGCVSIELDIKRGIQSILVENENPYQMQRFFLNQ